MGMEMKLFTKTGLRQVRSAWRGSHTAAEHAEPRLWINRDLRLQGIKPAPFNVKINFEEERSLRKETLSDLLNYSQECSDPECSLEYMGGNEFNPLKSVAIQQWRLLGECL